MKKLIQFIECLVIAAGMVFAIVAMMPHTIEDVPEVKDAYVVEKDEIVEVVKLAVEENQFTKELNFSTSKMIPFINFPIPGTKNQLDAKIEGTLGIGIDANEVEFSKSYDVNGNLETVTVYLPKSKILYEDIKETILKQDNGILNNNPVDLNAYQKKKQELVDSYKEKAEKEFDKADQKVKDLLEKHIKEITDETIQVVFQEKA